MGLARKAAEAIERKRRKPDSQETGEFNNIKNIGEQTKRSIYRVDARKEMERENLLKRLEASCDEMIDTIKAFGFKDELPSKTEIMNAIVKLGPDMLETIGKFGSPTVIITPKGSFRSKIKAIDKHKKMPGQTNTVCNPGPHWKMWGAAKTKLKVSVVDGQVLVPPPPYIASELTIVQKIARYEKEYAKNNMDVMDSHEGAMLIMQSLNKGQPESIAVTYYHSANIKEGWMTGAWHLPSGFWVAYYSHVGFSGMIPPGTRMHNFSCRPSVKVMEV